METRAVWKNEKLKYSKKTNDFQCDSQNDEVFPKVLIIIGFFNFMGLKWFPPYIRANRGPLKCEFVKFEGLLACYISKLIPMIGKLTIHNLETFHVPLKTHMACKWVLRCLLHTNFMTWWFSYHLDLFQGSHRTWGIL